MRTYYFHLAGRTYQITATSQARAAVKFAELTKTTNAASWR